MRGSKAPDPDVGQGIAAALRAAFQPGLRTIYPPERAAQARFDALIEQLKAEPGSNGGGNDEQNI